MAKVIIYLRDNELSALHNLAQHEYRAPKAQAALIIRQELQRLGMIPLESRNASSKAGPTLLTLSEPTGNQPSIPADSDLVQHSQVSEV
jgi:hypothetical protein